MANAKESYKSQLARKAADMLPRDLNTVENQRNVLYMVEVVIPMVSACRKHAEENLWPKAKSGEMTIQNARQQCGLVLNRLAGITIIENLKLNQRNKDDLAKAWGAMDSYAQVLKPEESAKLRVLMDEVAAVLEEKETGKRSAPQVSVQEDMSTVPIDTSKIVIPELKQAQNATRKPENASGTRSSAEIPGSGSGKKRRVNPVALIIAAVLVVAVAVVGVTIGWNTIRVNEVESAIDQIGLVTMESSGLIKSAELAYDELNDKQKESVENYTVLQDARAEYDRLEGLVNEAVTAIEDIGKVSLSSKAKIEKARKAFNALEPDNLTEYAAEEYKTLTAAEKEYDRLYAEDLYSNGMDLYGQEKYDEALAKFAEVVEKYPSHARAAESKTYAAKCMVIKAQASFDNGEYENAMIQLTEGREKYGETAENKDLTDKLIKKLESIRPKQNKKFKEKIDWGYGKLNVIADDQDVLVKVVSTTDPEAYMLFYVRAGTSYEVSLKNGDYKVYYGTGEYWYGEADGFGKQGEYKQVNKTFSFNSVREGSYIYYNARKLDLTGKVDATDVTYDKFWN